MTKQNRDPWHQKLFAYTVATVIWMGLLGLLYLYFLLTAPDALRQDKPGGSSPEATRNVTVLPRSPR